MCFFFQTAATSIRFIAWMKRVRDINDRASGLYQVCALFLPLHSRPAGVCFLILATRQDIFEQSRRRGPPLTDAFGLDQGASRGREGLKSVKGPTGREGSKHSCFQTLIMSFLGPLELCFSFVVRLIACGLVSRCNAKPREAVYMIQKVSKSFVTALFSFELAGPLQAPSQPGLQTVLPVIFLQPLLSYRTVQFLLQSVGLSVSCNLSLFFR